MNSKSLAGMLFAAALAAPPAFAYPSPSSSHISSTATATTAADEDVSPGLAPAHLLVSTVADARQQGGVRRPRSGGGGQSSGGQSGGGNNGGAVSRPRSSGGGERAGGSRPSGDSRRGAVRRESPPPPPPPSTPSSDGAHARTAPAYDHAIPRSEAPQRPSNPIDIYRPNPWPWYYDPWVYGGLGVGYGYYSPWSWYGPGWGPGYGYGHGYGYGYGYGYSRQDDDYDGKVRLKVKPRDAEVYVDGYYAGTVDDFDGTFQGLRLNPGGYRIEIRKPGFETLSYDVRVQSDRTITFEGEMQQEP